MKSWMLMNRTYSNLPPQEIAIINFLRNCYAFFKAHKRIPPPDRIFFSMYIFTYIISWDAGRCIVIFFTFEILTFRDHLEYFYCGFRANISIRFRAMGVSILEKFPLFNFGRNSQNSFCVRLGFSALILSHSLRKSNFWVTVQRSLTAWQTTLFWCCSFFGFGFAFLAIFCKSSSYSRNHWWNLRSITPSEDSIAAKYALISSIGTLENHAPSIFENIEHAQLEHLVILCPNTKK